MEYKGTYDLISALLFLLIAILIYFFLSRRYFVRYGGMRAYWIFNNESFSINYLVILAAKKDDMSESFKSFYDMKYQNLVFIIKGIGGIVVLFISTFLEKIITNEKSLTGTDIQLLAVTGFLILLVAYLSFSLRKISSEYAETIKIYYTLRP